MSVMHGTTAGHDTRLLSLFNHEVYVFNPYGACVLNIHTMVLGVSGISNAIKKNLPGEFEMAERCANLSLNWLRMDWAASHLLAENGSGFIHCTGNYHVRRITQQMHGPRRRKSAT